MGGGRRSARIWSARKSVALATGHCGARNGRASADSPVPSAVRWPTRAALSASFSLLSVLGTASSNA